MKRIEKCFVIIDRELKYITTKDEIRPLPQLISDEFDEFSYERKKAFEIIKKANLIYFRGTDDLNLHTRFAEITDEDRDVLEVRANNYFARPEIKEWDSSNNKTF